MERPFLKRRLRAILLADVVGYSRLMSVDEPGTHIKVNNYTKDLIEPKIAEHGGRLIRTMGDGFLAEFDSAADAVTCGLEIQEGLRTDDNAASSDRRIWLRIGINTGDVIADDHDIYGHSVNIAARLEGLAEPGEVYVTRAARDQLEGQPGLSFEDRGERRVKNIKTPIHVYRVKHAERPPHFLIAFARRFSPARLRFHSRTTIFSAAIVAAAITAGLAGLPIWRDPWRAAPRASIVVLPFTNLSNDAQQDNFADAVTDDLITDLSRVPGTFVIARGTAFTYKGKAVDSRQVGQECGVRYLLEGSINKISTRLQTNARLINTASALQIWADRFDSDAADLFELERAVTGRIASSLGIELVKAEGRIAMGELPVNLDATDLRVRAMSLYFAAITPEHSQQARRYLEEAVRRDPRSAEAWGWLAHIAATEYLRRWSGAGKEELREAEEAVRMALAIDPNLAQAHYAEGFVRRAIGEHEPALAAFTRAVELDRNFAAAYAERGNQLTLVGRPNEAPAQVERAITLSPRDPSLPGFYWIIGRAHFFLGHYREAIPWLQKSIALRPIQWYTRLYLVSALYLSNQDEEARRAFQDFNNQKQFSGFTLARVKSEEAPNDNPVVVAARQKHYQALRMVGMAEK